MATDCLNRSTVEDLLSGIEEFFHPWGSQNFAAPGVPLLRTWDEVSGSQPDENNRMNARAARQPLKSFESRQTSLGIHIDHKEWIETPYISFTSSPDAVRKLAEYRTSKRGPQSVTVIDPGVRLRNGLPLLKLDAEMRHYSAANPYGDKYLDDHYICLWQVTEDEIIGHWEWNELSTSSDWYEDKILPAFQSFCRPSPLDTLDVSAFMGCLSINDEPTKHLSLPSRTLDSATEKVAPDLPGSYEDHHRWYTSSDQGWNADDDDGWHTSIDEWDTDDEAEEANAADDMINIIEGNW